VAQRAILRPPSDLVVMASAAKLSIDDVRHHYIVGASAHLETDFRMAHITFKADAMKPVRKDYRTHPLFFRSLVDYYISIFGVDGKRSRQCEQSQHNKAWLGVSKVTFHSICLSRSCNCCTRHVMAAVAIGQGKCHRPVAAAAIFSIQVVKHAEFGSADLGFENFIMTIIAS
jgi:hypothetical protein